MKWRLVLGLVCTLLVAGAAQAEGWAADAANHLMSPFCPGRTLAECPSPQAKSLVVWLGVQEGAGRSREEVTAELVERYGENLLPAPPVRGVGVAAYVFPVLAFCLGGTVVWVYLRRQTGAPVPVDAPSVAGPVDPDLEAIVDRDLAG